MSSYEREMAKTDYRDLEKSLSVDDAKTNATFSHGIGLVRLPEQEKDVHANFEYAEHCYLGDSITLTLSNGATILAKKHPFKLSNGLLVTYGEINSLAGDFYGTTSPISDGKTWIEQADRFLSAYKTLADPSARQPGEALELLAVLQEEVKAVNDAVASGKDPSVVYSTLPSHNADFFRITRGRYLTLLGINWDHFGVDARTAYNAGHGVALDAAIKGNLDLAYSMNAFADHFLEDSFAAGHLRTPRRMLHSSYNPSADLCANYMHNEDNAIGLSVKNPKGETWKMYGDKRALDKVDGGNKIRCRAAVQASADEIYAAWKTRRKPTSAGYKAWGHAATLASAEAHQELAPLFRTGNQRRVNITDRRSWNYTTDWWYATTLTSMYLSGWWNYPITMNGPGGKGTAASTATHSQSCRVYRWTARYSKLFQAKTLTLIAACLLVCFILLIFVRSAML